MPNYPEIRTARPKPSAFWAANLIPGVFICANVTFIGFWSNRGQRQWAPTLRSGWCVRISHKGKWFRRNAWDIRKIRLMKNV